MKCYKTLMLSLLIVGYCDFACADIKIGTVYFYPPFILSPNQGFDADLSNALCQRMQMKCQLIPMEFKSLFTALNAGKIDMALGGIIISKERAAHYLFSLPYIMSKGQFLILKDAAVNSINELNGRNIGVLRGEQDGGVFYNYLLTHYGEKIEIKQFDDMEDMVTSLSEGGITAAFTHESTALYWVQNGGGQFSLLGNPSSVGDGIAIMALPEKTVLIQQINVQLKKWNKTTPT